MAIEASIGARSRNASEASKSLRHQQRIFSAHAIRIKHSERRINAVQCTATQPPKSLLLLATLLIAGCSASVGSNGRLGVSSRALLPALSTAQSSHLVDSMGHCGTCFKSPSLLIANVFNRVIDVEGSAGTIAPAARIVSIRFDNSPQNLPPRLCPLCTASRSRGRIALRSVTA